MGWQVPYNAGAMPIPQRELIAVLSDGRFHSGSELSEKWAVSRAAIAKAIGKLMPLGLDICAVKGKGYRLAERITLLDRDKILVAAGKATARIHRLDIFHSLPSTNSFMLDQITPGFGQVSDGFSICLAEMQTSGRGSRGRSWVSPFGHNIYMSVLKEFPAGAKSVGGLSLAIGLGLARALSRFGIADVGLKWPNDLLIKQRKVAGILLDIKGEALDACYVVIGIGLNLKLSAAQMATVEQPWTALVDHGFKIENRNELVGALIDSTIDVVDEFQKAGFEKFLAEWSALDLSKDREIELKSRSGTHSGIGSGVDKSGGLLVRTAHGVQLFESGEISLRFSDEVRQ